MSGSAINQQCFECENGTYVKIKEDYRTLIGKLHVVVPDVEVLICKHCGDEIIGDETNNNTIIKK